MNDAAMQALGSYRGGCWRFLGLGTGPASALIIDDGVVEPMELGNLPYKHGHSVGHAAVLNDQAKRHGARSGDRPLDHRVLRRKAWGEPSHGPGTTCGFFVPIVPTRRASVDRDKPQRRMCRNLDSGVEPSSRLLTTSLREACEPDSPTAAYWHRRCCGSEGRSGRDQRRRLILPGKCENRLTTR